MIRLEYFDGNEWTIVSDFYNERVAWMTLGGDNFNYRTVDTNTGVVLTDKSRTDRSKER